MKIFYGILIGLAVCIAAGIFIQRRRASAGTPATTPGSASASVPSPPVPTSSTANQPVTPSLVIPNSWDGIFAAIEAGTLKENTLVPNTLFNAAGAKVGYWTDDGAVYDNNGNLIVQGGYATV